MGTGKTEAAITYMNEHKEKKFIYITPYLAESNRIKDGCRELQFVEPSKRKADLIVPEGGHNLVALELLIKWVDNHLHTVEAE